MADELLLFVVVGFAAQLVDGAIGMAYGLSATTVLLSFGIAPVTASASVHAAEVFTTGLSGLAHWRLGNVNFNLFRRLALPGMIGGAIGAYVLTTLPGEAVRPFISLYLLAMGAVILWKALRWRPPTGDPPRRVAALGFIGAFLDAVGGGGWGADRHLRARRQRNGAALRDRLRQPGRVPGHGHHLGDLRHDHRPRALADHRRPHPGRRAGGAAGRLRDAEAARPAVDDPGRHRHHSPEHPRPDSNRRLSRGFGGSDREPRGKGEGI